MRGNTSFSAIKIESEEKTKYDTIYPYSKAEKNYQ